MASCMLPLPMGVTRGKQCTKTFLHYHRLKQEGGTNNNSSDNSAEESMIGRSSEDETEYSSRADEIEAWLKMYGRHYLGGDEGENMKGGEEDERTGYEWHRKEWKYVILDDRPTAAKQDSPLYDRFVQTETNVGLTDDDADLTIEILLCGPKDVSRRLVPLKRIAKVWVLGN